MWLRSVWWLMAALAVAAASEDADSEGAPYLELSDPEEGYQGSVRENETSVELTPAIRARGKICSFIILNNKHHGEAPFEIMVINDNEAALRARIPLNCEKRRSYKFDIAAVGCDGAYSNTVPVHIAVSDVNEYAPVFTEHAYVTQVDEGRVFDQILRLEALDRDCTPKYGDVCKYEILTADQPFAIDNEGVIRNTEPLDYERSHNHILSVVAYDCGMKQSSPVMVTIKVNRPCRAGWRGLAERVDYAASSGALALFPSAYLDACSSDERCPGVTKIQAVVTLKASHAGKGCDRDTYSVHSQKKICGANAESVELLPSSGAGAAWTSALHRDPGHDSENVFEFDGETTAARVPDSLVNHTLAGTFSLSTWLRHAPTPDQDKHKKEHILCLADDHKMNRHHFALFVRNCRLILLLRRDFGDGDLNIFRPAEWRWKIPEVCDNEWHHYSVRVRLPSVSLFIDGEPHRSVDGSNPEVVDDWPLHPARGINTRLTVGACWQGTDSKMKHYLKGSLAGLSLLLHGVEGHGQLKCLAQCKEGLSLAPDLYLSSVSVEGDSAADVETLLRKVTYSNARAFPTPGRRNVHVATTITCDNGRTLSARPADSYIQVLQPQTPSILISGSRDAARDYAHFRAGLSVFPDVAVRVLASDGDTLREPSAQKLDSCVVSVYPALNPDHESLSLGGADEKFDIRASVTRDGVIFTGSDSVFNYGQVLQSVRYSNKKPAYYLNRVFKLTCSELNGRFTSNEYVQTLTVVHPHMSAAEASQPHSDARAALSDQGDARADQIEMQRTNEVRAEPHALPAHAFLAHAQRDAHSVEMSPPRVLDITRPQTYSNHVALLIGVICAGVVVLGVVVGVARARPRRRRARAPRVAPPAVGAAADTEMAWDDSALTITVNPMDETEEAAGGDAGVEVGPGAEVCSSDGDSCSDSDSDDDSEQVVNQKQHKYRNINQLEWDNTTM